MIKEILINFIKENEHNSNICVSRDSLERIIINNNSFGNRIMFGNRIGLLQSHFINHKSEFICGNKHFICFESKILLIGETKDHLYSKGVLCYDRLLTSSFEHLMRFDKKLRHLIEPFTPKNLEKQKIEQEKQQKIEQQKKLEEVKGGIIKTLDKDGNGIIDIVEGDDFNILLKTHQKYIIELGRNDNKNYVQQFIQLKNYLIDERKNIQHLFNLLNDVQDQKLLDDYVNILNNNIHSYKILLIHSLNMICVLIEDDLLTFYDIYERLDKLNVFNSNFQNQMLSRLSNIETRLDDVIYSIQDMSLEIVSSLDMLTDEIQQSSNMLSKNLESIESSIDLNTFITGIGVYQMYKTNKKLN